MSVGVAQEYPRVVNVGGGIESACSLRQLTTWCDERFGAHHVNNDPRPHPFNLPWFVLDSSLAQTAWEWFPQTSHEAILEEIAAHAEAHPDWLDLSA